MPLNPHIPPVADPEMESVRLGVDASPASMAEHNEGAGDAENEIIACQGLETLCHLAAQQYFKKHPERKLG